jgi:gas vesicle protein
MNEYERYGDYSQQKPPEVEAGSGAGTAVTFLLIGVAIGAGVALLFTPVSGNELRNNIRRGYRNTLDSVSQGTQRLREHSSKLLGFNRWGWSRQTGQHQQG